MRESYNINGGVKSARKWKTLRHNGVLFPSPYEPHNIPIKYDGNDIPLVPHAEEMATLYAKCLDTEYVTNDISLGKDGRLLLCSLW